MLICWSAFVTSADRQMTMNSFSLRLPGSQEMSTTSRLVQDQSHFFGPVWQPGLVEWKLVVGRYYCKLAIGPVQVSQVEGTLTPTSTRQVERHACGKLGLDLHRTAIGRLVHRSLRGHSEVQPQSASTPPRGCGFAGYSLMYVNAWPFRMQMTRALTPTKSALPFSRDQPDR